MTFRGRESLVLGGTLTLLAAVAHLACIAIGPKAYRFMGAGERMVRASEAGSFKPTLITTVISGMLVVWALYAFSGAGMIGPLPFARLALWTISIAYLVRAFGFPVLRRAFPDNSLTFWLSSSSICLVLGTLYAIGALTLDELS